MNIVRIILSISVNNNWILYQMDVKNIFLQGTLEKEVYMNLPPGHKSAEGKNVVCKLNKSIYGLRQFPRTWYAELSSYLISLNFVLCNADHSLFLKTNNQLTTLVLVYVDDIIITENNHEEINTHQLKNKFDIKDL
jgi:Reverse transcriptase (RNA-dependent DNA polymerase)